MSDKKYPIWFLISFLLFNAFSILGPFVYLKKTSGTTADMLFWYVKVAVIIYPSWVVLMLILLAISRSLGKLRETLLILAFPCLYFLPFLWLVLSPEIPEFINSIQRFLN
ncbi:hypothetical protein MFMK1_002937 [Metallumcola ferriviriculae]|uniref:Uncharacterized protein n=1 Tax=Metallumcola ferriviriculae TaxID=3039180 RepID=A0AAU0UTB3_9FIRM|nr:hypothetical protein MFMK1_002937 [Desulfitibacteraceae bacterium MK1]